MTVNTFAINFRDGVRVQERIGHRDSEEALRVGMKGLGVSVIWILHKSQMYFISRCRLTFGPVAKETQLFKVVLAHDFLPHPREKFRREDSRKFSTLTISQPGPRLPPRLRSAVRFGGQCFAAFFVVFRARSTRRLARLGGTLLHGGDESSLRARGRVIISLVIHGRYGGRLEFTIWEISRLPRRDTLASGYESVA